MKLMMQIKPTTFVWPLLALSLALGACQRAETTPTPTPTPIVRTAVVDSVDVQIGEAFPVQVRLVVEGNLQDACWAVNQVTQRRDGNTFEVAITAARPWDAQCAAGRAPFEEVIALDVVGLKAGVYLVVVNGVSNNFELSVDNVPPTE